MMGGGSFSNDDIFRWTSVDLDSREEINEQQKTPASSVSLPKDKNYTLRRIIRLEQFQCNISNS